MNKLGRTPISEVYIPVFCLKVFFGSEEDVYVLFF